MSKLIVSIIIASLSLVSSMADAFTGEKYVIHARIPIGKARSIALSSYPGKVIGEKLERKAGGSGWRYSFDIKNGRVIQAVGVDAKTAKVLVNSPEGQHPY
jgi:uncharacterized membrane protein YkoI